LKTPIGVKQPVFAVESTLVYKFKVMTGCYDENFSSAAGLLHLSYLLNPNKKSNLSTQPYTHFLQLTYFLINKNKDFEG
jgi:hypothetical protein